MIQMLQEAKAIFSNLNYNFVIKKNTQFSKKTFYGKFHAK